MSGFRLFDLNPEQQDAVKHPGGPMLILAGAGTGKTRVITARIAYLIDRGVPASKILAVTFTNKAAREMRERIGRMVPAEKAEEITACTFHSLCVRILRRHAVLLGYKPNFSIFDEGDQSGLVKKLIVRCAGKDEKLEPSAALSAISRAKNSGRAFAENDESLLAEVARGYQKELKNQNAVDFDDLLVLAVRLLKEHEEARAFWRARYSHLLVDEFQDTNRLQLDLAGLLCPVEHPEICVVGDDDQSIYGWRGAEISNILEFERHFPNPAVFKLEQNYRSTNPILGCANRLIQNNARRRGKNLWSPAKGGEPVRVVGIPHEEEEAVLVADDIAGRRLTENLEWENFAVIYRMNNQARQIETEFRRRRIPYRVVGGKSFFDRREVKDLLAYCAAILNPDDDSALLRVIGCPPRGIGPGTISMALEESAAAGCSVQTMMAREEFASRFSKKAVAAMRAFAEELATLRIRAATPGANLAEILRTYLDECGYYDDLQRSCKTQEEYLNRSENLREMLESLTAYQLRAKSPDLQGFLDEMNLDREREEDRDDSKKGVTLITLHAAKGLEFPHVHLIGAEDGLLPHSRSVSEGQLDEERRLFYVGITRAMRSLTITYCRSRRQYGQLSPRSPSRFLEEIEGEGVESVSSSEILHAPADDAYADDMFARIRDMIQNS